MAETGRHAGKRQLQEGKEESVGSEILEELMGGRCEIRACDVCEWVGTGNHAGTMELQVGQESM